MTLILAYTPAGAYTGHPTLVEAVADLRQDLFDRLQNVPAGTSQRWADDDLTRALDRAIDEYSFVSPLRQAVMTATLPRTRAYAYPAGAWWIESVEYPTGLWPLQFQSFEELVTPSLGTPTLAPTPSDGGAGGPLTGTYQWAVTFVKSGGETLLGPLSNGLVVAGRTALLAALPLGPIGTVARNLYRAKGGLGAAQVTQILDNTTTTYLDAVADGALGAAAPTADTTASLPQFMLKLGTAYLPQDTSGVLTVTYAGKHQLATAGTSVPERHRDIVLTGAAAYAILAYQTPTNDLFEYQDGELRDRVDEKTIPAAWMEAGTRALGDFRDRLEEVKRQHNAGAASVATWGDEPVRWQRL